jgi:hypothetical protein
MLSKLTRAKYPDLTEEEERISLPLQTVCLAIFDMIMFHIMDVSAPGTWTQLKSTVLASRGNKMQRTLQILEDTYTNSDVISITEAAAGFIDDMSNNAHMKSSYFWPIPSRINMKKDQNSLLLLRRGKFKIDTVKEITQEIVATFAEGKCPIADGDLFAITVDANDQDTTTRGVVLAAFHGDTQGLATVPVVEAMSKIVSSKYPHHNIFLGLDANSYTKEKSGHLALSQLGDHLQKFGLQTCFGKPPDPSNVTTCMARTFLQPQLNKAVLAENRFNDGDNNPKDHIIIRESDVFVSAPSRDNTGMRQFAENATFPTLTFPSDHAIISVSIGFQTHASN